MSALSLFASYPSPNIAQPIDEPLDERDHNEHHPHHAEPNFRYHKVGYFERSWCHQRLSASVTVELLAVRSDQDVHSSGPRHWPIGPVSIRSPSHFDRRGLNPSALFIKARRYRSVAHAIVTIGYPRLTK